MGILDRLLGNSADKAPQPKVRFGRYTDSYKLPVNYDAWDIALAAFEEEKYLKSYRNFFKYLRNREEDNVHYWDENGGLMFEFFQGSKKITGYADNKSLKAEAKIARTNGLNVGFMRRLLEKNFALKYSRFGLDEEQNITIIFDTYTLDGSPYKLYYALKELATNADKQDDLLLDEFSMLKPVDTTHLVGLPPEEKQIKHQYILSSINRLSHQIDQGELPFDQYSGGYAYLMLDQVYRLDYLTKPEGYMMEALERLHREYFSKDDKSTLEKAQQLLKELRKLANRPKEEFYKEMYVGRSTFGITTPVNHDRVAAFIDGELGNMDWYLQHGHKHIALAIPGYIIGYCQFNYAVPKPDRELFHLYYQVSSPAYFADLGFTLPYVDLDTGKLNKRAIRRAIEDITDQNKERYHRMRPAIGSLQFDNLATFSRSFLLMIRNLNLTPAG